MFVRNWCVLVATALGLALAVPSVALAQLAPTGSHYAMRPSDTGHDPIGPTASGGFSPSLPLDLPPARGGLPIPLEIVSGTRGFGAAGLGWDLPLSYVFVDRSIAHRRPTYDPTHAITPRVRITVALPGRRADMIPVASSATQWIARDAPDLSMTYDAPTATYTAYDAKGFKYVFTQESSLLALTGGASSGGGLFLLKTITGPGGSTLLLTHNVAQVFLPDSSPAVTIDLGLIQYNSHPSVAGCYKTNITLGYEPDVIGAAPKAISMMGIIGVARQHKLDFIDISNRATCADAPVRLRRYSLSYTSDADTSLPRLSAVAVSGRDGTPEAGISLPVSAYTYGAATVPDNNGGRALQWLMTTTTALPSGVNYIASTTLATGQFQSPVGGSSSVSLQAFMDFTGDGRPDLVFSQGGQLMIARNDPAPGGATTLRTPVAFTDSTFTGRALSASSSTLRRFGSATPDSTNQDFVWRQTIDMNGDGRVDIVDAAEVPGKWIIYLNKPSTGPSGIQWVRRAVDVHRLRDALQNAGFAVPASYLPLSERRTGRSYTKQVCWIWTSSGYQQGSLPDTRCAANTGTFSNIQPEQTYTEWELADINSDGYPDFVFAESPASAIPPQAPQYAGPQITLPQPYGFKIIGSSNIDVDYDVAGLALHPDTGALDPFSATAFLYAGNGCGVERWSGTTFGITTVYSGTSGQKLDCTFVDVNGDGLLDRVEDDPSPASPADQQLVTLGTGSGFGPNTVTLPFYVSAQVSGYADHCGPNAPAPALAFTSTQISGLRDLTGDGIPDFIAPFAPSAGPQVFIGTGVQLIAAGSSISAGPLSYEDENCDGTGSYTSKGFYDIDDDGKPDWITLPPAQTSFQVYAVTNVEGAGAPGAGHIIGVDNGAGALTMVGYRSAKQDATTSHQVPFPEIVVDHTQTIDLHQFGGRFAKKTYAYGNISMFYDSPAGMFRPTSYLRTVAVTTTASAGTLSETKASAEFIDRLPFDGTVATTDTARFLRYQQPGRVADVTVLAVVANSDPWPLLTDTLSSDLRRSSGSHQDADGRVLAESGDYLAIDCLDISDPFDFEASQANNYGSNYRPCYAHGFVYTKLTSSWHGSSAPPMSGNVATRSSVSSIDDLGRPTRIYDEHDTARGDDDLCIDTVYAMPSSSTVHPPWSISSRTISACGKTGTAKFEVDSFNYDHLSANYVSAGLVTTRSTHSFTTDNGTDTGIVSYDVDYDASANPTYTSMTRSDGAKRSRTVTYDEFGLVPVHTAMQGTNVATQDTYNTVDPVTEEVLTSTDPNKTERGTTFDGFGRPLYQTLRQPGGTLGVVSAWSYAGFDEPDASGRRIDVTTFQDPVDPTQVKTAAGRHASTYLDELARPRRTAVALGDDYAGEVLVVGSRAYDDRGRVAFEADPYPASQDPATAYGTTRFYNQNGTIDVQIRGRGQQAYSRTVDDSVERYPTLFSYGFDNNQETTTTQTPDSLVSSSPQFNVQHQSVTTATGRPIARSTWQSGTRLDYEQLAYDPLGQLVTLTRYQDASTPARPVASTWQLDSQGRLITLTEPSNPPQKRTYDNWGELTQVESAPASQPVHDLKYTYDAFGRLVHAEEQNNYVADPNTKYDYGYDAPRVSPIVDNGYTLGRLSYAVGPTQEVRFGYDALGSQNAATYLDPDGSVYVEQSGHHADGTPAWLEVDLPDSSYQRERMDYEYDTAGRLRWMWYSDGYNTQEILNTGTIDAWGRLRDAKFGLTTFSAVYSDTGRRLPKSVKVTAGAETRSFTYGSVDTVGRELTRTYALPSFSGMETQTYDSLGRLKARNRKQGTTTTAQWSFNYDPLGNVTNLGDQIGTADATLSYLTTGDLDRICRIGYGNGGLGGTTCNVDYDSAGNVITEPTRTGTNKLTYFNSGPVHTITSTSGVAATFSYDAFGQLDLLHIDQSGAELREDRHYGALITKRTQKAATGTADYVSRQFPGPGVVISRRGKGAKWIYEFSETKGVRFTTDDSGKFVQDIDYVAYGEASSKGALPGTAEFTTNQWNEGDALDGLGLVQVGARIYDPVIGRFLSRDPLLVPRSSSTTNPYAFSFNDPANVSDPTGMDPNDPCAYAGGCSITSSYNGDSGGDSYVDPLGLLFSGVGYLLDGSGSSGSPGPAPTYVLFSGTPELSVTSGENGYALAIHSGWASTTASISDGGHTYSIDVGWMPPPPPPPPQIPVIHNWIFGNPVVGRIALETLALTVAQELLPELILGDMAVESALAADELTAAADLADAAQAAPTLSSDVDALAAYGRTVPTESGGYFNVVTHSDGQFAYVIRDGDWVRISHRTLARFIEESPGYSGQPIRLLACNAGGCATGLAGNLANKMGVEVLGADDLVHVTNVGTYWTDGAWNSFTPFTPP